MSTPRDTDPQQQQWCAKQGQVETVTLYNIKKFMPHMSMSKLRERIVNLQFFNRNLFRPLSKLVSSNVHKMNQKVTLWNHVYDS